MTEERARSHPGVLAGTHYCYRNRTKPGGWYVVSKAAMQRYKQSEKGRATRVRYNRSYNRSEKGLARRDRYEQTPKGIKAHIRAEAKKRGNL